MKSKLYEIEKVLKELNLENSKIIPNKFEVIRNIIKELEKEGFPYVK